MPDFNPFDMDLEGDVASSRKRTTLETNAAARRRIPNPDGPRVWREWCRARLPALPVAA